MPLKLFLHYQPHAWVSTQVQSRSLSISFSSMIITVYFLLFKYYRIPKGQIIQTISPTKVMLSSPNSIAPTFTNIAFTSGFNYSLDSILPSSLTHLSLSNCFNHHLEHLPLTLTHLAFLPFSPEFPDSNLEGITVYNHPLDHLPSSLTHLTTSDGFNHSIDHLPPSLMLLKLGISFNRPVDYLPCTLQSLELYSNFNQPVEYLPDSLTTLSLDINGFFIHSLDHLPSKLTYLKVRAASPVDNLPGQLRELHLTLQNDMLFSVDNLPPSLEKLTICNSFAIDHLPSSLKILSVSQPFSLDHLPQNLEQLRVAFYGPTSENAHWDHLPTSLTHLTIEGSNLPLDNLPPSLQHLQISRRSKYLDSDHLPRELVSLNIYSMFHNVDALPSSLQQLTLAMPANCNVSVLPPSLVKLSVTADIGESPLFSKLQNSHSLTHLHIYGQNFSIVSKLPGSLTHLSMDEFPNLTLPSSIVHLTYRGRQSLPWKEASDLPQLKFLDFYGNFPVNNLPITITELILRNDFDQSIDNLPPSLQTLQLGARFNQPVDHLPVSLQRLSFGITFNRTVDALPANLTHLKFGHSFNQTVDHLPLKLLYLIFGETFNQSIDRLPYALLYVHLGRDFAGSVQHVPPFTEVCAMNHVYIIDVLLR